MPNPTLPSGLLEELVQKSTYMFRGTIEKLNAATMPIVPVTESTAILRVDEVFQAPQILNDFTGHTITLQLNTLRSAKEGSQAAFFANGWLFGDSIALQEVGQLEVGRDTSALRKQISAAIQNVEDQGLQSLLAEADLVVIGIVSKTGIVPEQGKAGIPSFDNLEWRKAIIRVESVEKGQLPTKTVTVFYPSSNDTAWYRSPKFPLHQSGLWILHTNQMELLHIEDKVTGYTALDARDFQPEDQVERIRQLLK